LELDSLFIAVATEGRSNGPLMSTLGFSDQGEN
jgi:hypothetical protein